VDAELEEYEHGIRLLIEAVKASRLLSTQKAILSDLVECLERIEELAGDVYIEVEA
jgi:hypothetical protein